MSLVFLSSIPGCVSWLYHYYNTTTKFLIAWGEKLRGSEAGKRKTSDMVYMVYIAPPWTRGLDGPEVLAVQSLPDHGGKKVELPAWSRRLAIRSMLAYMQVATARSTPFFFFLRKLRKLRKRPMALGEIVCEVSPPTGQTSQIPMGQARLGPVLRFLPGFVMFAVASTRRCSHCVHANCSHWWVP
jgi:hypothetical protein